MNKQTLLEKFRSFPPRRRAVLVATAVLIALAIVVGIPAACYYAGKNASRAQAESDYTRERDANLKKIEQLEQKAARHAQNERELAAENALLKKQNEATAEILRKNDSVLRGDTRKFTELVEKRNEKLKNIDLDGDNFDVQLCRLCTDAVQSGFKPFSFCGRCDSDPQNNR